MCRWDLKVEIQVERLADRLAAAPLAAVYSSPLRRTVTTATVVGSPHGLTPVLADGLREIDHGRWEGLRRDEVQRMFPEEYAAWEMRPGACGAARWRGRGNRCSPERCRS